MDCRNSSDYGLSKEHQEKWRRYVFIWWSMEVWAVFIGHTLLYYFGVFDNEASLNLIVNGACTIMISAAEMLKPGLTRIQGNQN